MTEIKERNTRGFDVFFNPDRIVEYSKEHWSFFKYFLLVLLTGVILGFNFWQSNFMLQIFSGLVRLYPIFLLSGWAVLATFMAVYLFLLWLMARIFLKFSDRKRETNASHIKSGGNLITKGNLGGRIKVISYCYLLPFLFYEIVAFFSIILLYLLKALYLAVIIKDFGTLLIYVWIIPLTLHSINDVDKSQKYKMEALILISLLIMYMMQYFTIFAVAQAVAKILPTLL